MKRKMSNQNNICTIRKCILEISLFELNFQFSSWFEITPYTLIALKGYELICWKIIPSTKCWCMIFLFWLLRILSPCKFSIFISKITTLNTFLWYLDAKFKKKKNNQTAITEMLILSLNFEECIFQICVYLLFFFSV